MEDAIEGLLNDFDAGKMTRRQLIKSLAGVAMTAATPSGPAQAASPIPPARAPAPWKTVWLDHISFTVSDYRRSTAFYRDLLGWEIKTDNGRSQCSMAIGNIGGIIIRNRHAVSGGTGRAPQPGPPRIAGVVDHVSWGIEPWDTDMVRAELERRGLAPRPDMVGERFRSFHVKDPDGWDLQLSNQRDTREL